MKKKTRHRIRFGGPGLLVAVALTIAACTDTFDSLNTPDDRFVDDQMDASMVGSTFARSQLHSMKGQPGGGGYQIGKKLVADRYAQCSATTAENLGSDQYVEVGAWADNAWNYFCNNAAR